LQNFGPPGRTLSRLRVTGSGLPAIAMTTCRDFAARRQRASAGLHRRRWPVIGSSAAAGWNAAGIRSLATRRPAVSRTAGIRRRAALQLARPDRAIWRWPDEVGIAADAGSGVTGFHITVFELSYQGRDG
jgi:hypothetical protein